MAENNRTMAEKDGESTLPPSKMVIKDAIKDKEIPEVASFLISNDLLNIDDIFL